MQVRTSAERARVRSCTSSSRSMIPQIRSKKPRSPIINCLYFDSIGVPSPEQMIAEFGSGENWQRAKTFDWNGSISRRRSKSEP
jgi:hypothetical protein